MSFLRFAHWLFVTLRAVAVFIISAVPFASEVGWLVRQTIGPIAYRCLGLLKPVYRDSYRTHGLSLQAPLRC